MLPVSLIYSSPYALQKMRQCAPEFMQSPSLPLAQTLQFSVVHRRSYRRLITTWPLIVLGGSSVPVTEFSRPVLLKQRLITALISFGMKSILPLEFSLTGFGFPLHPS